MLQVENVKKFSEEINNAEVAHMRRRRKLSNIIVSTRAQLRLLIPFAVILGVGIFCITLIQYQVAEALGLVIKGQIHDISAVDEILSEITAFGAGGSFLLAFLCALFWLMYSHRIYGPTVALRRHIDNLKQGNYQARIRLRKHDELKNIAADLNSLAKILEEKAR
jgi:HAMP domain-containing protein